MINDATSRSMMNGRAGPKELSTNEFQRIATLLLSEAGIELTEGKLPLVHSRLSSRLRILGLCSYDSYCDFIESTEGKEERLEMLSTLTTNVTRFYREPHHFEYLRRDMVPNLAETLRKGGEVRIWSAGCASGEEPYTLALTFLTEIPGLEKYDFRILASDIDPTILKIAANGIYTERSLSQVPTEQKERFFRPCTNERTEWVVGSELRALITFRRLNLIGDWPFGRQFDVIMCRNVVIYFGAEAKEVVWSRLAQQVRPGGWLMTGHSERLPAQAAAMTEPVHTTTYRRLKAEPGPKEMTACH